VGTDVVSGFTVLSALIEVESTAIDEVSDSLDLFSEMFSQDANTIAVKAKRMYFFIFCLFFVLKII
jgi:hypothetical protein